MKKTKPEPAHILSVKPASPWHKVIPHGISLLVMIVVLALYFSPVVFQNKVISQQDIVQHTGMSKEIADFRNRTGEDPLWTNSMFSGMPAFQISVIYSGNLLHY